MQFLKSLFCLQGFDNRTRFFAIFSAVHIIFMMLASALVGQIIPSIILVILFSSVLALTSLRRLHDAKINKNWLFVPTLVFFLVACYIVISEQSSSYYLLLLPVICAAVLLTYPSAKNRHFILGYDGPVDLREYQQEAIQNKQAKFRIEPSLAGDSTIHFNPEEQSALHSQTIKEDNYVQRVSSQNAQSDLGEMIRLKVLANKKIQLAVVITIALTCIIVIAAWLFNDLKVENNTIEEEISEQTIVHSALNTTREHPLDMPDNYTLYLTEYDGIMLNWKADEVDTPLLWSQLTTQGDDSCKEISFNKGDSIRTISVEVADIGGTNTDYFASFSPLDSKALVQALAFRESFTLCGYNFSLKGSQAALGQNNRYAHWIDY